MREQLDTTKRKLDELHVRIDADAEAIKAQIGARPRGVREGVRRTRCPTQIDAVDADDVKAYLPAFIEDKFKEWAELEGAKLAAMLEHLAEEVISITNENVAAAAADARRAARARGHAASTSPSTASSTTSASTRSARSARR